MRRESEETFDPSKPTLIVVYGATRRKYRPLVGDVVLVGRGPCCDIGLVSPEVAPVHALIARKRDGWTIRDCSGRATRVNGTSVSNAPLRNGDVIQIGTFSFEAHLPPEGTPAVPVAALPAVPVARPPERGEPGGPTAVLTRACERLQASRRRLVELALSMRSRLREQVVQGNEQARQAQDLGVMERRLRQAHQEQMARQARMREQEQALGQRAEELDAYARHLRREQERPPRPERLAPVPTVEALRQQIEAETARLRGELQQEREQLTAREEQLQRRMTETEARVAELHRLLGREREHIERQREQVTRERGYLDLQRQELVRERAELQFLMNTILDTAGVGTPSARDTQVDGEPANRLELTQQVLRELAVVRKSSTMIPAVKPGAPRSGEGTARS